MTAEVAANLPMVAINYLNVPYYLFIVKKGLIYAELIPPGQTLPPLPFHSTFFFYSCRTHPYITKLANSYLVAKQSFVFNMLLLTTRTAPMINTRLCIQTLKYSTVPKQAAGRFTSNKLISQPIEGHTKDVQKTLVYIGNV